MAYGNQGRRHGNVYYAGKYAARGLGSFYAPLWQLGNAKWGWKKGGKIFKRLSGGIRGPRARLSVNRPSGRQYSGGSNPGHRLGSNKGKRTVTFGVGGGVLNRGRHARQRRYKY